MKKYLFVILIAPFLLLSSCGEKSDDCHKFITVDNKSEKRLLITQTYIYPDSITDFGHGNSDHIIKPYEKNDYAISSSDCYEYRINDRNQYGVLMLYIMDYNQIKDIPKDTIIKYRMYLKKYDLTVEDLQKRNWTITYP